MVRIYLLHTVEYHLLLMWCFGKVDLATHGAMGLEVLRKITSLTGNPSPQHPQPPKRKGCLPAETSAGPVTDLETRMLEFRVCRAAVLDGLATNTNLMTTHYLDLLTPHTT